MKIYKQNTKGSIQSLDENIAGAVQHKINFQFNPNSFTETRAVDYNFSESQGQMLPLAQYVKVDNTTIRFELFLFNHDSVKKEVQSLRRLTLPKKFSNLTYYEQVSPHKYMLSLGGIGAFIGVVSSLELSIKQYHRETMDPTHVMANVEFICVSSSLSQDITHLRSITGVKNG